MLKIYSPIKQNDKEKYLPLPFMIVFRGNCSRSENMYFFN